MTEVKSTLPQVITAIRATPNCFVSPPAGLPHIDGAFLLPADVREFYRLCGGAVLFRGSVYGLTIVPPARLRLANSAILIGAAAEQLAALNDHPSRSWHIIGEGLNSMYVTIDLASEKLGFCYDSYWDVHPHDSTMIARSFSEFLMRLLATKGAEWYW